MPSLSKNDKNLKACPHGVYDLVETDTFQKWGRRRRWKGSKLKVPEAVSSVKKEVFVSIYKSIPLQM